MAASELSMINAVEVANIIISVKDLSPDTSEREDFMKLGDWHRDNFKEYKPYQYYHYPDIFHLEGSIRKKYRYSIFKDYDIIDIYNSIRLALAQFHYYLKDDPSHDIVINSFSDDNTVFKVLENFIPDEIQDFIEVIESIDDESDLSYEFSKIAIYKFGKKEDDELTMNAVNYDEESFFNNLSFQEKKVFIYCRCHHSIKFNEWSNLHREYILNEEDEDLEGFKSFLLNIDSFSYHEYLELVYKKLKLKKMPFF